LAQGDCRVICLTHVSLTLIKKRLRGVQVSKKEECLTLEKKCGIGKYH